jgi:hypothetical protein
LQVLDGEAMHGWRATHQAKYAGVILRVTSALGKMPAMPGTLDALLADALEGPLPDDTSTLARSASKGIEAQPTKNPAANSSFIPEPSSLSPPPSRDCSPPPSSRPSVAQTAAPSATVTPSPAKPSDDLRLATSARRRAFLAPAHPAKSNGDNEPITELQITPKTLGFTT